MTFRKNILEAIYEAGRFHKEYDSHARTERGAGRVDVFGMLIDRDIPVMFRPLKNLLGAYIDDPCKGIMVTTERPLAVQRFTAAHELGHAALGHEASFDDENVLMRALFVAGSNSDRREMQANAFATELLTPQWLIVEHMTRQGWTRENLTDPMIVYQLALRMGSSYTATCYALAECGGIDTASCVKLLSVKVKSVKQSLVKSYQPANWYGDVWLVTERDNGMILEGSRSDLVIMRLQEHASSGYVWQFGQLADIGLAIKEDGRDGGFGSHVGGVIFRTVVAEATNGANGHLNIRELRPWLKSGTPLNTMELDVDLSGPVHAGLLPKQLEALLEVA